MISSKLMVEVKKRMEPYPCEGFLLGGGDEKASVLFVGEAPGRDEVMTGKPFTGKAGQILDTYFHRLNLQRDDVYISSTVRSRPYKTDKKSAQKPIEKRGNRKPTQAEIIAHAPLLDAQIEAIAPKVIVTLGGVALHRLVGPDAKISIIHGRPFCTQIRMLKHWDDKRLSRGEQWHIVFPTFHPASVFYNPSLKQEIAGDMQQLRKLLQVEGIYES
ncbi:uracil-DNA glycosylase [Shouchella shacheensis]|uniref:uracil-DNA glycosylase n=1 Tax=Shouchella shacheensis TaxID=1649580 RepID=UPI00074038F1|nr:uracil-DNA glycosylase [Shouchella shacheensis]